MRLWPSQPREATRDATDNWGDTALIQVARQGSWPAVLDALLEFDAKPDQPNKLGRTALMDTADDTSPHQQAMIRALIRRGVSVNRRDDLGQTAVYFAARAGVEEKVTILLEAGADTTIATRDGDTPLIVAPYKGSAGLIQLLLSAGASPRAANKHGETALYWAAFYHNVPAMSTLIRAGADPNGCRSDGTSVLMTAAIRGNQRAVEILLAAKADANARIADGRGVLMLMLGTPDPSPETMSKLIAAGANPNWTDQYGRTALKLARVRGNLREVEQLLVQAGGRE